MATKYRSGLAVRLKVCPWRSVASRSTVWRREAPVRKSAWGICSAPGNAGQGLGLGQPRPGLPQLEIPAKGPLHRRVQAGGHQTRATTAPGPARLSRHDGTSAVWKPAAAPGSARCTGYNRRWQTGTAKQRGPSARYYIPHPRICIRGGPLHCLFREDLIGGKVVTGAERSTHARRKGHSHAVRRLLSVTLRPWAVCAATLSRHL